MRRWIGLIFLLFQAGMIVYARFTPSRYFCWAPYDSLSEYRIDVKVDGRSLGDEEIYQRYRMRAEGLDARSIQHLKNIIRQYEETYGRDDKAQVLLSYHTNGIPQPVWSWPPAQGGG